MVWLQIVYGIYPNWTYGFAPPEGLLKIVDRVLVGCSDLFALIDFFAWSKNSSCYSFNTFFLDWWLMCTIFIGSVFIYPETCSLLWLQIFSRTHTNQTCGFSSHASLCNVITRVPILWFHLSPSIHWLSSSQFLNFFKISVV